jgi:AraC-like DNA-binding protein
VQESLDTIQYVFRLLAASQILMLCLYMMVYQRNGLGWLIALSSFSFASYLVVPFSRDIWGFDFLHQIFIFLAASIPALLWLLARRFFSDEERAPIWFWFAWLLYLALGLPNWRSQGTVIDPGLSNFAFYLLPQLIKLGFVLHVIFLAFEGRANDLVAQRLKLRIPVAIAAGTVTAVVILVEIGSGGPVPVMVATVGSVAMFAVALFANLYLFRLRPDLPLTGVIGINVAAARGSAAPIEDSAAEREIERIEAVMIDERFYATHGATIGDLSDHVAIPAYRLRALINQRLGYRNFNQYLNHYRIKEATDRLHSEPGLPILSIALDTGFKSVSSFNTAFKAAHQKTPSEFRQSRLPG